MDNAEAAALLKDYLEGYRLRSYADLVTLLGKPQVTVAPAVRCVSSGPSMMAAGEVASRFVWKFGAALPVPLADALSRRTTIVDLCHSG